MGYFVDERPIEERMHDVVVRVAATPCVCTWEEWRGRGTNLLCAPCGAKDILAAERAARDCYRRCYRRF